MGGGGGGYPAVLQFAGTSYSSALMMKTHRLYKCQALTWVSVLCDLSETYGLGSVHSTLDEFENAGFHPGGGGTPKKNG